ncbi:GRP family sugar transporter [Terribacillus aidingensis]|uniref:GRP family sugar transporter n=1 Tax=Terribacillus aidingensis TaxID=586416 RepID=UPI00344CD48F
MDILLAVLPALFWGSIVLFNVKLGGTPYHQILGTTIGALLLSIVLYFFVRPELTGFIFLIGFLSGVFWSLGQTFQLKSVHAIGVSRTMPISTGAQLVSTSLFGVIVFGEWNTARSVILGILALLLIIIGAMLTSKRAKGEQTDEASRGAFRKGLIFIAISTVGYLVYVVIARLFGVDGWTALFPQAVGMVAGGIILTVKYRPYDFYTIKNIIPGLIWATGNMFLFISQPRVGVATSFSLSQMGIVISTLGGIFILGEKKTRGQLISISIGIILIVIAGFLLGYTKS